MAAVVGGDRNVVVVVVVVVVVGSLRIVGDCAGIAAVGGTAAVGKTAAGCIGARPGVRSVVRPFRCCSLLVERVRQLEFIDSMR